MTPSARSHPKHRLPNPAKALLACLRVGLLRALGTLASAQGGSVSGSVKDGASDQKLQGVLLTIADASTGQPAALGTTDAQGQFSISIPRLGRFTLPASKLGYRAMAAPVALDYNLLGHAGLGAIK